MLHDTTRVKMSHRPSLLHLLDEDDQSLYQSIPELPGTPTLHRPSIPPPPPPTNHPLLQPFNSLELSRINNVIKNNLSASNGLDVVGEFSGSEFSEDEFDDDDIEYENIPAANAERLPPEGAEADISDYDVPELNQSFDHADTENTVDEKLPVTDLDISFSSSCIADISADSLMLPAPVSSVQHEQSFDQDSIDVEDDLLSSGSIIQNHGEKTIILSPGMAQSKVSENDSKIFISSSSWINIDGSNDRVSVSSVVSGEKNNSADTTPGNTELASSSDSAPEPVKPPRLKKLARQQSKQEMLRAKGFGGLSDGGKKMIKGLNNNLVNTAGAVHKNNINRPEISSPILINSTFNSEDYQKHKCITINRSDVPFILHSMASMESESEVGSVYRSNSSDTDSSIYNPESVMEEHTVYNSGSLAPSDIYSEHIYEEIPENSAGNKVRPLPPIPEGSTGTTIVTSKSIFTGATKYEILHYLNDAKQRIEGTVVTSSSNAAEFDNINEDSEMRDSETFLGTRNHKHRVSAISNISDSSNSSNDSGGSGDGSVLWRGPLEKVAGRVEIERNDSGVGSDSGMSSSAKMTPTVGEVATTCEDCEVTLTEEENICSKCVKRRGERKEIITEIVDTEVKYGRDLRIIVEEFYRPMLVAGLLSSDQLASIFLNVEQLIQVNTSFSDKLKEALDEAAGAGDDDLLSVQIGILFINAMPMLQAFEAYCTKQVSVR